MADMQNRKKKIILQITIWLSVFLILCTVISKSFYTSLLPEVELCPISSGALSETADFTGKVAYTNEEEIISNSDCTISEVHIKDGEKIARGGLLFEVDIKAAQLEAERMELDILRLQNQLSPPKNPDADDKKSELEAELAVSIQNLMLHMNQSDVENKKVENRLKLNIAQLKNQLDTFDVSEDNSFELRLKMKVARDDLSKMITDGKPADELDKQRLVIAALQTDLDFYYLTHAKERAITQELENAQYELDSFVQNARPLADFEQSKLELDILRLQNQLKDEPALTEQDSAVIKKQLSIARTELGIHKQSYPADGKIIAQSDGVISGLAVEKFDKTTQGQVLATIRTEESEQCIMWETSLAEGNSSAYDVGTEILADIGASKDGKSQKAPMKISKKELSEEKKQWIFSASYQEDEPLNENQQVKITITSTSDSYRFIVPLSCVIPVSGGKYAIHTLEKRQGLFSEEDIIVETQIELLDKNNLYAAIAADELYDSMRLVKYSSKPISNGSVVSVVK